MTKLQTTGWPVVDSQSEFSIEEAKRFLQRRTGKQSELVIAANLFELNRFSVHDGLQACIPKSLLNRGGNVFTVY